MNKNAQFRIERVKRGLTQRALAIQMGITERAVNRVEVGATRFHMTNMLKWAEIMNMTMSEALRIVSREPRPDEERIASIVK